MWVLLIALAGCASTGLGHVRPADRSTHHAVSAHRASAAAAYLAAIDAAEPAWNAVDKSIVDRKLTLCRCDLLAQAKADAPFVADLEQIDFPPESAPQAKAFIDAVVAYDTFLMAGYSDPDMWVKNQVEDDRLNAVRSRDASRLRDALGLPQAIGTHHRP